MVNHNMFNSQHFQAVLGGIQAGDALFSFPSKQLFSILTLLINFQHLGPDQNIFMHLSLCQFLFHNLMFIVYNLEFVCL